MNKINNSLKIVFLVANVNITSGSYRIWVNDYCRYFNAIGVNSKILTLQNTTEEIIKDTDVLIMGKCLHGDIKSLFDQTKKANPDILIGTITPPRDLTSVNFDFVMVGSLEEADSLSFYDNIILNAHIESLYYNSDIKTHSPVDILKICYHGWTPHLFSFVGGLKMALEDFSKSRKIELNILSEKSESEINWTADLGRPDIPIVFKKWNIATVRDDIGQCDIGICPGVHDLTFQLSTINQNHGKFQSDYIMRYKNKTNNGRALAFMALGVPVIADFSPSNFHLFGDEKNGYVAHTPMGWLRSFNRLSDFNIRNKVAKNAKIFLDNNYDPYNWALRYYSSILEIYQNKQKEK
ncbi:hypothetical protein CL614_06765 [archaeon]|nr:hypothetical protein [archaeon]|tara:strand:+ start:3694 stop:4746 length:1053 start_codon:yes stop_codon:yes gene_type:complete